MMKSLKILKRSCPKYNKVDFQEDRSTARRQERGRVRFEEERNVILIIKNLGEDIMTAQMMIQPSSLLPNGIEIRQVNNFNLFKFTDDLQARSDELLERNKVGLLTPEEAAELAGISELSRIFTLINAMVIAKP